MADIVHYVTMRIIAGTHRSRPILAPRDSSTTRPITDRVKQALFDRLTIMEAFDGACLDLFAGTGSLGLEALSRGMEHCTFVENHRAARQLLERNIDALGLADQSAVLNVDALAGNWMMLLPRRPVNLILCDPPYPITAEAQGLQRVLRLIENLAGVATDEAVLVLRAQTETVVPAAAGWHEPHRYVYGSMALWFFEKIARDQPPAAADQPSTA
jgi:16S rRNA (guanine966-N2)-methyltransferase